MNKTQFSDSEYRRYKGGGSMERLIKNLRLVNFLLVIG